MLNFNSTVCVNNQNQFCAILDTDLNFLAKRNLMLFERKQAEQNCTLRDYIYLTKMYWK